MKISCKTIQGEANRLIDRPNQDALSIQYSQGITGVCLCDGAGFSEYGGLAAKEVSELVCSYMINNFYKWRTEKSRIQLIQLIDNKINLLAKQNNSIRTLFATTIMGVVIDDKNMMIIHLGDGNILGQSITDDSIKYLSSAQHGTFKNQTYLTGSDYLHKRLRVYSSRKIQKYKNIYMITDGCDECLGDFYETILNESLNALQNSNIITDDDYSIIKIAINQ